MLSTTSSPWIFATLKGRPIICVPQIVVPVVSMYCPWWGCFCTHDKKKLYFQKYWKLYQWGNREYWDRKELKTRDSFFLIRPYSPQIRLLQIILKIVCISELKLRLGQSLHDLFSFFRKCCQRHNYNVLYESPSHLAFQLTLQSSLVNILAIVLGRSQITSSKIHGRQSCCGRRKEKWLPWAHVFEH